ncbi:hypothetical protein CEUSTIGMA_g4017.t1 [Chlamydomonas eustigma]|uniref:Uncharacterized protein n=1 Tax=Chlamydomonas eustigma TaxID=1157962 RepID=A0A250X0H1_9CHLO|nr:hypothetical protein CEUSTIGMA_g4017.t1 [Chlamydomonas eustigma]|eukprot:GAX76571.1 hypothetical protein CEUSTIGMA_g4017.t1 [Chlamydomonas eustigma]
MSPATIARGLNAAGFVTAVRSTAQVPRPAAVSILRQLQNEYLVVQQPFLGEEEDVYVDAGFRYHFDLPGLGSIAYQQVVDALPKVFVGKMNELVQIVKHMSILMALEYSSKDLALPPWRTLQALLSRWPAPPTRSLGSNVSFHSATLPRSSSWGSRDGTKSNGASPDGHLSVMPTRVVFDKAVKSVVGFDIVQSAVTLVTEIEAQNDVHIGSVVGETLEQRLELVSADWVADSEGEDSDAEDVGGESEQPSTLLDREASVVNEDSGDEPDGGLIDVAEKDAEVVADFPDNSFSADIQKLDQGVLFLPPGVDDTTDSFQKTHLLKHMEDTVKLCL